MASLCLCPIGHVESTLLSSLAPRIESTFQCSVTVCGKVLDPQIARDPARLQYHAGTLLAAMLAEAQPGVDKVLGVTGVDLFIPIFTFLFGQAQLGGRGGLFSTHRLHPSFYGMPENRARFLERAVKEAVHELGHMFGLKHCFDPTCVMRSSTYIEDVDQKGAEFCHACRRTLKTGM